jgi:hypothetical protein
VKVKPLFIIFMTLGFSCRNNQEIRELHKKLTALQEKKATDEKEFASFKVLYARNSAIIDSLKSKGLITPAVRETHDSLFKVGARLALAIVNDQAGIVKIQDELE